MWNEMSFYICVTINTRAVSPPIRPHHGLFGTALCCFCSKCTVCIIYHGSIEGGRIQHITNAFIIIINIVTNLELFQIHKHCVNRQSLWSRVGNKWLNLLCQQTEI